MATKVSWTEAAWSDVDAAARHIARDSPSYAAAFIRRVREAARSLRSLPERGTPVDEGGDGRIRELYVQSYRLIYQVRERGVVILALVHGARDLRAFWRIRGEGRRG